jgi:hypothetical protein
VETVRGILKVDLPPPRPFQFRLRTLMILIAVAGSACAFAAHWRRTAQVADTARIERDVLYVRYDAGLERPESAINAFRNWCLSECNVPFADRAGACGAYAAMIQHCIKRWQDQCFLPHDKVDDVVAQNLKDYQTEAAEWLAHGTALGTPSTLKPLSE